jgi:very-short-patch-repair endonuclease
MILGYVRRGTLVWTSPTDDTVLPGQLRQFQPPRKISHSKFAGTLKKVVTENPYCEPIEQLRPNDLILGPDGEIHSLSRLIRSVHRGVMVGILLPESPERIWVTADQRLLGRTLPRTHLAPSSREKVMESSATTPSSNDSSSAAQRLWSILQSSPFGSKFQARERLGKDVVDLYSLFHQLVVLIDSDRKPTHDEMRFAIQRDARLRLLGLDVLHFAAGTVEKDLAQVLRAIQHQMKIRRENLGESRWIQAGSFLPGDWLTFGSDGKAIEIKSCEHIYSEEEAFSLELEDASSYLTLSATLLAELKPDSDLPQSIIPGSFLIPRS